MDESPLLPHSIPTHFLKNFLQKSKATQPCKVLKQSGSKYSKNVKDKDSELHYKYLLTISNSYLFGGKKSSPGRLHCTTEQRGSNRSKKRQSSPGGVALLVGVWSGAPKGIRINS